MRLCVTGAAGMTGAVTVTHLLEAGYDVLATDVRPRPAGLPSPDDHPRFGYLRADLTDYGDTVDLLRGVDAVVHLANIPAPGLLPDARTFQTNCAMNGNVFLAAAQLGLQKVVWASSETTLGLAFGPDNPPRYAPVDEAHYPYPESTYALSKVVGETTAGHVAAWSGIPFLALRLSNVIPTARYAIFPGFQDDPLKRVWNLWGYIDVRDAAQACRRAIETDVDGARSYVIANDDTVMRRPSRDLMAEVFPDVPVADDLSEFGTLLSNAKAKAELGFAPEHSWRDEVSD